jgi:hypothetical protein
LHTNSNFIHGLDKKQGMSLYPADCSRALKQQIDRRSVNYIHNLAGGLYDYQRSIYIFVPWSPAFGQAYQQFVNSGMFMQGSLPYSGMEHILGGGFGSIPGSGYTAMPGAGFPSVPRRGYTAMPGAGFPSVPRRGYTAMPGGRSEPSYQRHLPTNASTYFRLGQDIGEGAFGDDNWDFGGGGIGDVGGAGIMDFGGF